MCVVMDIIVVFLTTIGKVEYESIRLKKLDFASICLIDWDDDRPT